MCDGAGIRVVAGDIAERAVVADAGAVELERAVDGNAAGEDELGFEAGLVGDDDITAGAEGAVVAGLQAAAADEDAAGEGIGAVENPGAGAFFAEEDFAGRAVIGDDAGDSAVAGGIGPC